MYCFSTLILERFSWFKLFKNSCVCFLILFYQNATAQSKIDSIRVPPIKFQLNLIFGDSNQYKFQIQDLTKDSIVSSDISLVKLSMDSAILVIQKSIENLRQNRSITNNYVVLYILNLNFKMEEMHCLIEKLSEIGVRVKVEFSLKK